MENKIGILRGINVGGKRKVLMEDLRNLCENLGLEKVQSYIQSGNLIFNSATQNSELENILEKAIFSQFGFKIPVIVRDQKELEASIESNPFEKSDINKLHLTLLKEISAQESIQAIEDFNSEPDKFVIQEKDIYIVCENKYHKSKLSNNFFEKKLQVVATTRNWKTLTKLVELCKQRETN